MCPSKKTIDDHINDLTALRNAAMDARLMRLAKEAVAWGRPDTESLGMSQHELISIIQQLINRIERK